MDNFKKYAIYFFLTLLLFTASEVVFNYHNKTPELVSSYFKLSNFCIENKMYTCGSFFLNRLADIKYEYYKKNNPRLYAESLNIYIDKKLLLKQSIDKSNWVELKLTSIYYQLGLEAYNNGDTYSAIDVWQKVIYIDPETSFLYIELANLYQKLNKSDMATQVLERCLQFVYPKNHCQEYLNNLSIDQIQEPGFYKDNVNEPF